MLLSRVRVSELGFCACEEADEDGGDNEEEEDENEKQLGERGKRLLEDLSELGGERRIALVLRVCRRVSQQRCRLWGRE